MNGLAQERLCTAYTAAAALIGALVQLHVGRVFGAEKITFAA
jgi:hypothetical protein